MRAAVVTSGGRMAGALVTLALLAVACGSGRDQPALSPAWTVDDIEPIGQPVRVNDDLVVAYGTVGERLFLYGVATADGSVRWRQPASPGAVVSGISLTPTVIDGEPVLFRPDTGHLTARLVVVVPATGEARWASEPFRFHSRPRRCHDERDVCAVVGGDSRRAMRFDWATGGARVDHGESPQDARPVGEDLVDPGRRDPEMLARIDDGRTVWQVPLAELFSADHTTDHGWHFELYASEDTYVGTVGLPADRSQPDEVVFDLSREQTAAFDAATGARRWRAEATSFGCRGAIRLSRDAGEGRWETRPVRCRYEGLVRFASGSETASYDGLTVTVEGFDVRTGETTWSLPLGRAEHLASGRQEAPVVSATEVLLRGAGGPVILDVADGSSRIPDGDDTVWCPDDVIFRYAVPLSFHSGPHYTRRGGILVRPCSVSGEAATAVPGSVPPSLGAWSGDRVVVATPEGLVAYDRVGRT